MKWRTVKAGALCEITSSKRIFAADYVADGVPFLRGKEISEKYNGSQTLSTELFISRSKFEEIASKFGAPSAGDLLLTSVGTLGNPYLVKDDDEFYFKDGNITWFRAFDGIDSSYLYFWIQSPLGRAQLARSTIGTSQSAYTIELLKRMDVLVPPLRMQRHIALILSAYDQQMENNQRRMAMLEKAARLLYEEWFVRLRFPGHEHTPITHGLPQGWERKPLNAICPDLRDAANPADLEPGTPYIGLEHMPRRSITLLDWGTTEDVTSTKLRYLAGDILFGKIRPYFHKVGFALTDGVTSSDAIVLRPREPLHYSFALLTVSSDWFVTIVSKTAKEGSKMPRADWKLMEKHALAIPPHSLLETLNEAVRPMLDQLRILALQNQKLRAARDLLLPRLMSGELEV